MWPWKKRKLPTPPPQACTNHDFNSWGLYAYASKQKPIYIPAGATVEITVEFDTWEYERRCGKCGFIEKRDAHDDDVARTFLRP